MSLERETWVVQSASIMHVLLVAYVSLEAIELLCELEEYFESLMIYAHMFLPEGIKVGDLCWF